MTILVVTAQLISNLQSVTLFRGGAPYPEPFATIVRACEIFNLDAFAVFRVGCIASGYGHVYKLYVATIASITVVVLVYFYRMSRVLYGGRFWDGFEMKLMFLLIFFTLPTVRLCAREGGGWVGGLRGVHGHDQ